MKKSLRLTVLMAPLALAPVLAVAQSQEPEWRVTNPNPPRVIPLYAGQPNPFPIKAPPAAVLLKAPEVPVLDDNARALATARLEAENAIRAGGGLVPNTGLLRPQGYLKGPKGAMVLVGGRWYGVGQSIAVANSLNPVAMAKVDALAGLDESLRQSLQGDLKARLVKQPVGYVRIKALTDREVTFATPHGETKVAISQQAW